MASSNEIGIGWVVLFMLFCVGAWAVGSIDDAVSPPDTLDCIFSEADYTAAECEEVMDPSTDLHSEP